MHGSPLPDAKFQARFPFLTVLSLLVIAVGMPVNVMNIDAAQYAAMSLEMLQSGRFLEVYEQGRDYLDKPPLVFWTGAFSFWLFGVSDFAYKLPSVLFSLLGAWSLFRFARLYYPASTARLAAWMLLTSQAFFLMNQDIRTDNLLLGAFLLTCWQIAGYEKNRKAIYLLGTGLGLGLGMLAKGPMGLVFPVLTFVPVWLIQGRWRLILSPGWLLSLFIAALLLAPMCYGLFTQFDQQPGKLIHGRTGVSGLYFYFWEQSFGRITGASEWKNQTGPLFFVHTYLWAFLPWVALLIPALAGRVLTLRRQPWPEYYSLCGWLLVLLALSSSRYKLPHYCYVTLPFAALICASWWQQAATARMIRFLSVYSWVITGVVALFCILVTTWIFPVPGITGLLVTLGGSAVIVILYILYGQDGHRWFWRLSGSALILNLVMNAWFYPALLKYQSSSRAMQWLRAEGIPSTSVYRFQTDATALHFYNRLPVHELDPGSLPTSGGPIYVYTHDAGREALAAHLQTTEVAARFADFPVTRLQWPFLDPGTRDKKTKNYYLIRINR